MTGGDREAVGVEESTRARLGVLARTAGVAAPPVRVVPAEKAVEPVRLGGWPGVDSIVVSAGLASMPSAAQDWHLASALGWWTSLVPRRRTWCFNALLIAALVAGLMVVVGPVLDDFSNWLRAGIPLAMGEAVQLLKAWRLRSRQRALDAAGADLLAAAGSDPGSAARIALGGDPPPPWWKRAHATTLAPRERVAAAERRGTRPAPPLH